MKKPIFLFTTLIMALSMTGCSGPQNYFTNLISEQMIQKSGIYEDINYQEYQQYTSEGMLDADGYYVETISESVEEHAPIHVTFSENNNLDILYYYDSACTRTIDTTNCYLNPGDAIYAVVYVDDEIFSNMYSFSGFRIYEYDSEETRIQSPSLEMKEKNGTYILTIPESYTGTDLSIEPVGTYEMRTISLRDYYTDDNGQENDLAGTWLINDKEYTSDTAEINPVSSFIISYKYDSNEYFYVSSSPECYYQNNTDGVIIFNQHEIDDENENYSVELHKYISVTLVSDKPRKVSVNDNDSQTVQTNEELILDHLKYGDTVTILTDSEWGNLASNQNLILTNVEPLSSGQYKYTMIVPEKDGEFIFDPSAYTYEHGIITFKCFGLTVSTTQILAKGSRIYYEQADADKGWWLAGNASEHYITVGDEAETQAALEKIHFTQKVNVTVELPQPSKGGSIIYKLNGSKVSEASVSAYSGDIITMKFTPWEGWISSVTGELTYIVDTDLAQTVSADGQDIDTILTEDESHKPELSLNLEKSVGESMEFTLTASGYSMDAERYDGGWRVTNIIEDSGNYDLISNKEKILSNQKIGTDQPITITMSNRAIQSGTAVRMVITYTDSENKMSSETRYIDDLSNTIEPIYIYQPGTNATSTTWYKSIDITIGVVDIETFKPVSANAHSKLTVKNQSTNKALRSGDYIEASSKVIVTIWPDPGYYVSGNMVTSDIYSAVMKFSDYQKNISSILSNHTIRKYCTINLDTSDSFANYTYKLDGKEVSGTIYAKKGQNLELTYEITDEQHKLTEFHGGVPFVGWGSSNTKVTETISITSDMDGTTISKSNFGIKIK